MNPVCPCIGGRADVNPKPVVQAPEHDQVDGSWLANTPGASCHCLTWSGHATLVNADFNGIEHLKQGLFECDQKLHGFKILGVPGIDGYYCERGEFIMQADPILRDANLKWLKKDLLLTAMEHPLMLSWLY